MSELPDGMEVIPNEWGMSGYPLGHDCWFNFTQDSQGREIGLIYWHRDVTTGVIHAGGVLFDTETGREHRPGAAHWQLLTREPLTLAPSLLCNCGHHCFIRNGAVELC